MPYPRRSPAFSRTTWSLDLRACRVRHEPERRRACFRADHGRDVAGGAAVLRPVGGVDLVVDAGVRFLHEGDVLLDAPGPDPPFVARLGGAEPGAAAPAPGADVEIVADADDPDRHRRAQRAVASPWRDLQFVCSSDRVELVVRPGGHCGSSLNALGRSGYGERDPTSIFTASADVRGAAAP